MIFTFDDCELDTDLFELRRGGTTEPIEPQVFDVLRYLVAHHDRVVTKHELLDNVWGDRFVSESALTSRIKAARRAIGDDGRNQRTIRTVHGRGYRFVAQLREEASDWPQPPDGLGATRPPVVPTGSGVEPGESSAGSRVAPGGSPTGPGVATGVAASPAGAGPPVETVGSGTATAAATVMLPADDLARGAEERLAWPMVGRAVALRVLAEVAADDTAGGVLVTGGAGVGKTRLTDEFVAHLEATGMPVARATGHPAARGIPLAALAHLLPPDIAAATGADGELDRGVVFHAARQALGRSDGGRRTLLVVDDADQVDELSSALLASLILGRSVAAVLTLRSDGRPTPFDHLVKDGHLRRLDLEPLEAEAVETLLHRVLGGPMVAESIEQLVSSSLGNPGILRQLVESALDAETLVEHDGVWRLTGPLQPTASLQRVVVGRLTDLSDQHRHAIEVLAIAGRLGLDLLIGLVGEDPIEDLERRGLVTVRTSRRRTEATLAHPLFGEVVMAELPVTRGRRLRRELADALQATGARRREDGMRLVAWRLDGGGDVALALLFRAARLALIEGEDALAERLLARALAEGGGAEAMLLMAELHFRRGDPHQVETVLSQVDLGELDQPVRARAVRRRSVNLYYGLTRPSDALAVADEGLAHITDPVARVTVQAARAVVQTMAGDVKGALAETDGWEARTTDPLARFEFVRARSLALATAGRGEEALALVTEGEAIHRGFEDELSRPGFTVLAFNQLTALVELGRFAEARALLHQLRADRSDPNAALWQAFAGARLEVKAGNPRAALRLSEGPARWSRAHGQWGAERWVLALVGMARLLAGDLDQATDDIERVRSLETAERGLFTTDRDRAYGWLAAARGDVEAACDLLLAAADDARRREVHALEAMVLHDLVRFGAAGRVADRLGELAAIVDGRLMAARATHAAGVAGNDEGQLAAAADGFERLGSPLFAAEAAVQLCQLHRAAGRSADAEAVAARARTLRAAADGRITSPALRLLDDRP